ncbi:MAG: prepilin-type N-terminal cleavage/methylation domain-containing protein [Gemmatimonadota bacterium]|nr:prepilin-type N-terminal cleavage/methylation domain-containing protein [Gemmatimonadota bacterium]
MRNNKGFTLIEIIVAVALVAILSAAIAPSVLNNIAQGRISRAQSDVQAIASAIVRFRTDTGYYPRMIEVRGDTTKISFLASEAGAWAQAAAAEEWPTAMSSSAGADASCEDYTSHLIRGMSRQGDLTGADSTYYYYRSDNPIDPNKIGFRSSLMNSDPTDPWGHRYMCNVRSLEVVGEPVWIISAGPDGLFQTDMTQGDPAVTGNGASATLDGDDIGYRVQ